MSAQDGNHESDAGARLSIGALSRSTGIPVETLRTWERRYGFPVPDRKPSGHRVYPLSAVPRLRRIAEVLALGHRAAEVVSAGEDELSRLLDASRARAPRRLRRMPAHHAGLDELMEAVGNFDADRLTRTLLADWARLDHLEFLESRVSPLVRATGMAWESGALEVCGEHFVSERIGDLLRSLRLPLQERGDGPYVILASLPGETHGLGLQMAALVIALAGCRVMQLGTEVPLQELAALSRELDARALGISVSIATRGPETGASLRHLKELLPRRTELLVGGDGAPRPQLGLRVLSGLRSLDAWARQLHAANPAR